MKRCIKTHQHRKFGEIPEGSLWDDDSPFVDDTHFEVVAEKTKKPAKPVEED